MTQDSHQLREPCGLTYAQLGDLSDDRVMAHLAAGHGDALSVLLDRYERLVLSIAFRIVRNHAEAEDVAQEIFLELCRTAARFDPSRGSTKMWIVRTAYRRSLNRRRYLNVRDARLPGDGEELLKSQSAMEHEQELLSVGRDIRDLMGARNLHIIDVHDMDARGEARPFGRIFLTEGKRLIFYAYDLDTARAKDASFQAWGQRENGSQATISLGLLYMDDQKQSWGALKVEGPNLLKTINSVFVTVEPNGGTAKPTGKKLMYAYLRNPINHP